MILISFIVFELLVLLKDDGCVLFFVFAVYFLDYFGSLLLFLFDFRVVGCHYLCSLWESELSDLSWLFLLGFDLLFDFLEDVMMFFYGLYHVEIIDGRDNIHLIGDLLGCDHFELIDHHGFPLL